MTEGWFEVWWDYSSRPPQLLVLTGGQAPDKFEILEPGGAKVHQTRSYKEAMFWLTEDEYTLIEGRTSLD